MMAKAYDLKPALATCDSLADYIAEDGCWQGVFMENVNADASSTTRGPGVFSRAQIRSRRATRLDGQVRARVLHQPRGLADGGSRSYDLRQGVPGSASARRGPPRLDLRAEDLGLMVTNPTWQASLAPKLKGMANEKIAWRLCLRFPAELRKDCVIAAVDNIASFDEVDVSRANRFCALVTADDVSACYQQIGVNLSRRVTSSEEAQQRCSAVPAAHRDECRSGTSVAAPPPPPPTQKPATTTTPAATTTQAPVKGAVVVKMTDDGFSPDHVTIARGQTITFVNTGKDDKWPHQPAPDPHGLRGLRPRPQHPARRLLVVHVQAQGDVGLPQPPRPDRDRDDHGALAACGRVRSLDAVADVARAGELRARVASFGLGAVDGAEIEPMP